MAHQGGGDVDVVGCVADGDPAAGGGVAFGGDSGGVDDAPGDGGPLGVVEVAVFGGGAEGAVPDLLGRRTVAEGFDRLVELIGELGDLVPFGVGARVGCEVVPGGDEVLIGVFVRLAGAEEVVDEGETAVGADADLGDHRRTIQATASSTASMEAPRRASSCRSPAPGWPPALT